MPDRDHRVAGCGRRDSVVHYLRSRHFVGAIAWVVFLLHTLTAAEGQAPQSRAPGDPQVFRASTELIRLDVSVTDENGVPVSDLKVTDFEVLQDGKRQRVQFAAYRDGDVPAARATAMSAAEPPSHDSRVGAAPSAIAAGRRLLFVIDDLHMGFDSIAYVREDLTKVVDEGLQAGDQVRIIGTRDSNDASRTFTSDRDLIRRQIETLHWEAFGQSEPLMPRLRCGDLPDGLFEPGGSEGTLAAVASAIVDLQGSPGRKTVVLLSDGLQGPCDQYPSWFHERLRRISDLASRSSAIIYGLQPRALSSGVRMPEHRTAESADSFEAATVHNLVSDSLRRLAEPTGGFARRSNSVRDLIDAALADQQGYYSLAYEPPAGTFEGPKLKYRTLTVRVNRKGPKVRTRGGFYSVTDEAALLRH